jgi:large subunit ribosomal protein L25
MNEGVLHAKEREIGKSKTKQVRKQKMIPGIFYVTREQAVPIAFEELELKKTLSEDSALIRLMMPDGQERECVVREIQRDPVWGNIIHIDFMGIIRGLKLTATVPLHLKGSPLGVKEGGILEHTLRELEIECFPKDLPRFLEWDVTELHIGDSIRVEHLNFENIKILTDAHNPIATVVAPRIEKVVAEVVEAVEEGEGAAEEGEEKEEEGKEKGKEKDKEKEGK